MNQLVDHNLIIPAFIKVYIQETLLEDISSNVALRTHALSVNTRDTTRHTLQDTLQDTTREYFIERSVRT